MLEAYDWKPLFDLNTTNEKADFLVDKLQSKMDEYYPLLKRVTKSTDAPWMTPFIKRRIKSRKRVYDREERSTNWKVHKKETASLVKNAKKEYYDKFVKLAKETNNPSLYYQVVGCLKNREAPPPFSPADIFPGESHSVVAEKSADFFTKISERFEPLTARDLPRKEGNDPAFRVRADEIEKRLRECKKPRGLLKGDIWPDQLTKHSK